MLGSIDYILERWVESLGLVMNRVLRDQDTLILMEVTRGSFLPLFRLAVLF